MNVRALEFSHTEKSFNNFEILMPVWFDALTLEKQELVKGEFLNEIRIGTLGQVSEEFKNKIMAE